MASFFSRSLLVCCGVWSVAVPLWGSDCAAGPQVRIALSSRGTVHQITVTLSDPGDVRAARRCARRELPWPQLLAVYVESSETKSPRIPVLGRYVWSARRITFTPRFAFRPGLAYRVHWRGSREVRQLVRVPRVEQPAPELVAVYPTSAKVPENLLRLYFQFSRPMTQGDSYRHIQLLDASGTPVELPFLELGEELWDPTGTRLTVLFDPGRIKRGLKPREEVGPILEEGKRYRLTVSDRWLDAAGRPLKRGFERLWEATGPDHRQPDPERWQITPPRQGTRQPLSVRFAGPLDHGMLQRVLGVVSPQGRAVMGEIEVDQRETRWRFRPQREWSSGTYRLLVDTALEDAAGNSIKRPFEVDVFRQIQPRLRSETVDLPIEIE